MSVLSSICLVSLSSVGAVGCVAFRWLHETHKPPSRGLSRTPPPHPPPPPPRSHRCPLDPVVLRVGLLASFPSFGKNRGVPTETGDVIVATLLVSAFSSTRRACAPSSLFNILYTWQGISQIQFRYNCGTYSSQDTGANTHSHRTMPRSTRAGLLATAAVMVWTGFLPDAPLPSPFFGFVIPPNGATSTTLFLFCRSGFQSLGPTVCRLGLEDRPQVPRT